jgi:ribosomal protein S18 acetylase RimI-like enzyme
VGFALFRTGPPGNIHLSSMGILEGCRGKGLSKPFLEESLTYWKKEGFRSTTLYVDNTNYIALKTYNSLGYLSKKNIINKIFMLKSL